MKTSRKIFDSATSRALGARLRSLRGDRTLAEFAELVGVGRSVWSNYEAGRRLPSHETLARVAELADVQLDSILPTMPLRRSTAPLSGSDDQQAEATALWLYERLRAHPATGDRYLYWAERWPSLVAELSNRIHDEAVATDKPLEQAAEAVRIQLSKRTDDELRAFVEDAVSQ